MNKIEIIYAGNFDRAMVIYNRLVWARSHRKPIVLSDSVRQIYKDNVYVTDVIKTFKDGLDIVSIRYYHNPELISPWFQGFFSTKHTQYSYCQDVYDEECKL